MIQEPLKLLNSVIGVLALASVLGLGYGYYAHGAYTQPAVVMPDISPLPGLLEVPTLSAEDFLQRPLFWSGRRAIVTESIGEDTPPPPPQQDLLADVRLLGVVASSGQSHVILARGERRWRLAEGAQLGDWTLSAVDPESATFTLHGETRTLHIQRTRKQP